MSEYDFNDLRRAVADHLASKPPADRVPRTPLSRADLLRLNALADRVVANEAGKLLCDVDGNPVGVSAGGRTEAMLAGVVVTRRILDAAGVAESEVPNLTVVRCG